MDCGAPVSGRPPYSPSSTFTWTRAGVSACRPCTSIIRRAAVRSAEDGTQIQTRVACVEIRPALRMSQIQAWSSNAQGPSLSAACCELQCSAVQCSLESSHRGRHKHGRRMNGRDHRSACQWRRTRRFDRRLSWQLQPQSAATQDSPFSSRVLRQEMPATLFAGEGGLMGSRDWTALRQHRKGLPAQRREACNLYSTVRSERQLRY